MIIQIQFFCLAEAYSGKTCALYNPFEDRKHKKPLFSIPFLISQLYNSIHSTKTPLLYKFHKSTNELLPHPNSPNHRTKRKTFQKLTKFSTQVNKSETTSENP
jgi:hypothetical protein